MSGIAEFAVTSFVAIFAIVNPIGNLSFFATLTQGYTKELKKRVTNKAVLAATLTLFIFGLAGNYIFILFNTSIPAFRIAGGILLLSIAFSMMHGERSRTQLTVEDSEEALRKEAVGVVPLGIPMFAGPGAITTVIAYMAEASQPIDLVKIVLVFMGIIGTMIISYGLLSYADAIFKRMGRMGALAFSRIMGLILAAMAIQFVILGIQGAWLLYFGGSSP